MKVILERKGTQDRKIYGCDSYFIAKQIHDWLQNTINKDNDYLVFIED